MPAGRPTDYTQELADIICARVAEGESMRSIGRDESMPVVSTLFLWLRKHPEFSEQYAKAKEECHTAWFEDIVDIADNQVGNPVLVDDQPMLVDGKPVMAVDAPSVNHAKLRVDSRKWALSKLMPKKYGDRIENVHSGSLGLHDLSDEELQRRVAELRQSEQQSRAD